MPVWIQDNLFALGAYALTLVVWLTRGEGKTTANTASIDRLESTIKDLIKKIETLIDRDADMRERMADHAARITNLETRL